MKTTTPHLLRAAMTLLVTVLTTLTAAGAADVIDLTFAGRGDATTAESVTVTNLTHPDIAPVTLSGSATLRLIDVAAAMRKGDVNTDNQVGIGDIVAITNVMAGTDTDTGLKTRSDVNGDGEVGIGDIVAITNLMAGNFGVSSTDAVTMEYNAGDILRFDGTSDGMRTIMHLTPESSHPVTFDFFRCQDADGYNYPIVRAGDMLWMIEDLHPLKMNGLLNTDNASLWQSISDQQAAVFVSGNRGYYTVSGARMAMPEGWQMPSIDEIYAFAKELHADTLKLGDFMKDRDYSWELPLTEGLDTIHMQLLPNGYITPNGDLAEYSVTGAWATRTTINHGSPVSYEIKATDTRLYPMVVHAKRCGFTVRGCRPAPSPYQEMLKRTFESDKLSKVASPHKLPMQLVNDNGALGAYYTYGSNRYSIFFDYSSRQYNSSNNEKRSGVLYMYNPTKWSFESKGIVPLDVNGVASTQQLRKVAAQGNTSGYENVVYATWSKQFRVFTDGSTTGNVASVASVMGEGVVNITIFGDSTKSHAILDGYATRPLLDANGGEYKWTMPTFNNSKLSFTQYPEMGDSPFYFNAFLSDIRSEYFARAFNLNCIQDQTGDGIEDIVMNVANKIAVFDGVSLRCIREREFENMGSYIGTPNLRFDVADVNGDGREDIVLLLNNRNGMCYLHVYSDGHIDEEPIFKFEFGSDALFCDVKVGTMSGSELPEIAVLTRGLRSGSNNKLTKEGYLSMLRLKYDPNMELKHIVIFDKLSVGCFEDGSHDDLCYHVGNMNLVFGYFRGHSYNQDLIVGDGLWRWDDNSGKPTYRFQVLADTKNKVITVPADAIAAVQTYDGDNSPLNSKDNLKFIWSITRGKMGGIEYWTFSEFGESYLSANGNSATTGALFNEKYFGWGNSGDSWSNPSFDAWMKYSNGNNPELTKWLKLSGGDEINSHPVLCKFADRERAKHFKFLTHELTFSEPRIYAAIAAAPYYADLGYENASTTWGGTSSTANSEVKTDTWGGSVIAGYEYDYSIPFLAKGGVEFTAKVSASGAKATGYSESETFGYSTSATDQHMILMQATPYDTYRYEIIDSDDPDEIGLEFVVSIPRTRSFVPITLQDYMLLTASQKGVSKPQHYLTSTPGQPWTYPANYDVIERYETDAYPYLKGRIDNSEETQVVGSGGFSTRNISLASNKSSTSSVSIGVETELVATVNGVKAGVGFNYGNTKEFTHEIGREFNVEGSVPGLPSVNDDNHKQFRWNVVWYYVKDEGGIYPVVNYVVMP